MLRAPAVSMPAGSDIYSSTYTVSLSGSKLWTDMQNSFSSGVLGVWRTGSVDSQPVHAACSH